MITQELLLLGLLKQGPKHGYDIKIKIKEILSLFAGVDLKSIYYPLRILEERGLVAKRVSKPTNRPERSVYYLTPKGEARFSEVLTKNLLNFKRPQFSLDLSLYFLDYIKPGIAKRRLRARTQVLKQLAESLRQMAASLRNKKTSAFVYIIEHNLQMVETEEKFLYNLLHKLPS